MEKMKRSVCWWLCNSLGGEWAIPTKASDNVVYGNAVVFLDN